MVEAEFKVLAPESFVAKLDILVMSSSVAGDEVGRLSTSLGLEPDLWGVLFNVNSGFILELRSGLRIDCWTTLPVPIDNKDPEENL